MSVRVRPGRGGRLAQRTILRSLLADLKFVSYLSAKAHCFETEKAASVKNRKSSQEIYRSVF